MASSNDGWEDVPVDHAGDHDGWEDVPVHHDPKVNEGQALISNFVQKLPFGKQITAGLGTLGVQAAKALGAGDSSILTPQAREEIRARGETPADEQNSIPGWADTYRQGREQIDQTARLGEQQHENYATLGKGLGIADDLVLSSALPFAKVGTGLKGALASGAINGGVVGGAQGLADSNADLTKGEFGQAGLDALKGAGIGAGIGAAGGAVAHGAGVLAEKAGGKVQAALEKARQMAADKVEKDVAKAGGEFGAEVQKGNRLMENLIRLKQAGVLSPELSAKLEALEKSGDWEKLGQRLAGSNLETLPEQIGTINAKEAAYKALAQGKDAAINAATEEIASPAMALRQVGDRMKRYLPRTAGEIAGKVLGTADAPSMVQGQILGPAVHALKRMVNHPSVQSPIWKSVGKVARIAATDPAKLGAYGSVFVSALQRGGKDAVNSTHFVLSQTDPAYQQHLDSLPDDEQTP